MQKSALQRVQKSAQKEVQSVSQCHRMCIIFIDSKKMDAKNAMCKINVSTYYVSCEVQASFAL
jgi:hypothetical protein